MLTSAGAMAKVALTHTAAATLIAHLRRASPKLLPCRKPLTSAPSRHHKASPWAEVPPRMPSQVPYLHETF